MASHERKTLVQRPEVRVDGCSCGVYHVATGPVTLRMRRPQLEALFEALGVVLGPTASDEPKRDAPVH